MKKLMICLMLAVATLTVQAQSCSKEVKKWSKSKEWRQGFTKANPHKTLNWSEFHSQYKKNTEQWKTLFQWLRDTDLTAIPKGKHPIPNSTLVASVEDSENAPVEKRNTESHRKKIDFQLVVRGTEGFALLDHESSTIKNPYDEKKDVQRYNYMAEKTNFFDVKAGQFVIFFPTDWHIAKINNKRKGDDQQIRVIVIKVDYVE